MLFDSLRFGFFFIPVFAVAVSLPHRAQNRWLLLVSFDLARLGRGNRQSNSAWSELLSGQRHVLTLLGDRTACGELSDRRRHLRPGRDLGDQFVDLIRRRASSEI